MTTGPTTHGFCDAGSYHCDDCASRFADHSITHDGKTIYRCCACHVAAGGSPSEWHPACQEAWKRKRNPPAQDPPADTQMDTQTDAEKLIRRLASLYKVDVNLPLEEAAEATHTAILKSLSDTIHLRSEADRWRCRSIESAANGMPLSASRADGVYQGLLMAVEWLEDRRRTRTH